jgi:alanine racemase
MARNLALLRDAVPNARFWAVVKAAAYGHGLDAAVEGFQEADGLALIEPPAALQLRARGWKKPILLMEGVFDTEDLRACGRHGVEVVVHAHWQEQFHEDPDACALQVPRVWVKANLGMNRLGFSPEHAIEVARHLRERGQPCGLMAHFANADRVGGDQEVEARALAWLGEARQQLEGVELSLANSAATLRLGAFAEVPIPAPLAGDWVRCGIALYGASPFGHLHASTLGLVPAMALNSRVLAVQDLEPGETVGYGSRFVAKRRTRVGVVAGGYADGYPRHAPDGTPVWVEGVRCGLAGRVSMDLLTVDLSDHPRAGPGSPVQLWGEHVAVDEVALASGTIGYQLLCGLAPRVRRVVRRGGLGA